MEGHIGTLETVVYSKYVVEPFYKRHIGTLGTVLNQRFHCK